jgi:hypothetical protein
MASAMFRRVFCFSLISMSVTGSGFLDADEAREDLTVGIPHH